LAYLRNIGDRAEHLSYTTRAISTLQKRIQDPLQCTGDDVVGAVLAFVCFAVRIVALIAEVNESLARGYLADQALLQNLTHNADTMRIHFAGLLDIIDRRGGVATLESNPAFRIMLFW
jgi:hypothetical protein